MFFYLLLLFISVPLIELWLILLVHEHIGLGWTIGIIIATGALGSYLARRQGRKIIANIRNELNQGRVPGDKIVQGLLLLIGGFVLLFPGYITDFIGFMLLVPGNRRLLARYIRRRLGHHVQVADVTDSDEQ
jgi:UPF0716 protein FxsA